MLQMQRRGMVNGLNISSESIANLKSKICKTCLEAKQTRSPFFASNAYTTKPLQLIHMDVMGPLPIPSLSGKKYISTFLDGYSRFFSNKGEMLFRGERVPVVGTVCMDYSLLDLTKVVGGGEVPVSGENIVVFGSQGKSTLSVNELTDRIGTIPYEMVTGLTARVPRVYS